MWGDRIMLRELESVQWTLIRSIFIQQTIQIPPWKSCVFPELSSLSMNKNLLYLPILHSLSLSSLPSFDFWSLFFGVVELSEYPFLFTFPYADNNDDDDAVRFLPTTLRSPSLIPKNHPTRKKIWRENLYVNWGEENKGIKENTNLQFFSHFFMNRWYRKAIRLPYTCRRRIRISKERNQECEDLEDETRRRIADRNRQSLGKLRRFYHIYIFSSVVQLLIYVCSYGSTWLILPKELCNCV